jgi:hypothetical protein
MSWEARGTFRPRVRFTCNRFPSCGWQGEEKKSKEYRRKEETEEMEGPQDKINS